MSEKRGVHLDFDGALITPGDQHIRRFEDIPDILTMTIPPIEFLVDGMISRGTITLWAGADGVAKTFLAHHMAVACATGAKFLGRRCQESPVLILDYENPSYAIRDRLETLASAPVPNLKVWGTWLEQQPPAIGSELLLTIAKESRPLILIDPFRYSHAADENDSGQMATIMQQLRYCAAKGAAVVILHHVAKAEGSNGRGSSVIRGAVDVAYVQTMDPESGLISLKCDKNRFGESHYAITIRPDFESGTFDVTDSPRFVRHTQDLDAIRKIITEQPGLSQNAVHQKSGMKRERVFRLLKENIGSLWQVHEQGRSRLYYPMVPTNGNHHGNQGTTEGVLGGSMVPSLKEGTIGTIPFRTNGGGSQSKERLCAAHGFHCDWLQSDGIHICTRCHPGGGIQ